MKHIISFVFSFIFLFSCGLKISSSQNDSVTYKELTKGFYFGSDNKMYIQTTEFPDDGKDNKKGALFFREVPLIDVATFENLGQDGWYTKDKNHVYIDNSMTDGRHIYVLKEADAGSFQAIGYRWGKDKYHVYENGIILKGLNPDSMIILCPETTQNNEFFFSMVKNNNHVFYGHQEMTGVDAITFECIKSDSSVTYRDKNWIYNKNYFPNMDESDKIKR